MNISKNNPKTFTFGTVIENADDIPLDEEATFVVYKVGIGKSFCTKQNSNDENNIEKEL